MEPKQITRDELVAFMNSSQKIQIVDVLDPEIYARQHIKGAISIPLLELQVKAPQLLDKNAIIITYCGSFECPMSTNAAKILLSLGFPNVLDYKGGLKDYRAANLPLEGSLHMARVSLRTIKFQGSPLTLVGRKIAVGMQAPFFKAVNAKLEEVTLNNFKGKTKILTSFPSLDTPVCDLQVKAFNKEAANLGSDVAIVGISKDLPFAQARFCQANGINNLTLLSDYKTSSFGINYGMLIKENNLLARSIVIVDSADIIRYVQIVDELTSQPNYAEALEQLKIITQTPSALQTQGLSGKCVPCEAGTPPLTTDKIQQFLHNLTGWQLVEDKKLVKEFRFKDFVEATYFFNLLAVIAEEQGHHPTFTISYNKIKITLTTHVAAGLTENDFVMARLIDEIISLS